LFILVAKKSWQSTEPSLRYYMAAVGGGGDGLREKIA